MTKNSLLDLASLAQSTALVNYTGAVSININRFTHQGETHTTTQLFLHGQEGIDFAIASGIVPTKWYNSNRPQRSYTIMVDEVEVHIFEMAPEGSTLVDGGLVLPSSVA